MIYLISKIVKKIAFFLGVSLFSFLISQYLNISISKVSAADLSLGISPPIIEIQISPPAIINEPITIENHGNQTVMLKIEFKPFTAGKGEQGEVVYESGKNPLIFENIKIIEDDKTVEKVVLAPKETKILNLHLDIPQDEKLSDYYFSVIFVSENLQEEKLNQLKIQGGIATNVLLSIKGNPPLIGAKPTSIGKIVEFSTPSYFEKGPVPFTVRLKNQSNHFIAPKGSISIKNIFGKTIGQIKLSPINILTNTIRLENSVWKEDILLGLYTATLTIYMSHKEPVLIESISFFVFPFRPFIVLAIAVSGILLMRNRLKRYRKG